MKKAKQQKRYIKIQFFSPHSIGFGVQHSTHTSQRPALRQCDEFSCKPLQPFSSLDFFLSLKIFKKNTFRDASRWSWAWVDGWVCVCVSVRLWVCVKQENKHRAKRIHWENHNFTREATSAPTQTRRGCWADIIIHINSSTHDYRSSICES